jgi:hypothetical protein
MPSTTLNAFTQLKLEPAQNPDLARTIAVLLKASTTYVRGCILGEIAASPGTYNTFNPNANDGTQLPKVLLAYSVITDSSGVPTNVTYPYGSASGSSMPAYSRGEFDCATIATAMGDSGALLAAALNVPGFGHLIQGTAAAGIVQIG